MFEGWKGAAWLLMAALFAMHRSWSWSTDRGSVAVGFMDDEGRRRAQARYRFARAVNRVVALVVVAAALNAWMRT